MLRGKTKRRSREFADVLTELDIDRSGSISRRRRTSGRRRRSAKLGTEHTKGREIEIRWGRPPNMQGNGKTERKRRDERDGVLTFGQRWTTATEELAGVGEELAGVREDDGGDVGFAWLSTSRCRVQRGKLHGGVHLHRKCTVSPEVRRNLVDAKVRRGFVRARLIQTERGWRRWKEDAKEIADNYLFAEIESNFISFFNFGN
jgi:hypothetical protein